MWGAANRKIATTPSGKVFATLLPAGVLIQRNTEFAFGTSMRQNHPVQLDMAYISLNEVFLNIMAKRHQNDLA